MEMKVFLVLCAVVAIATIVVIPAEASAEVKVISQEQIVGRDGKYYYHYELDNGSKQTQEGWLKHVDAEHDGEAVQGKFSFIADDGKTYAVSYTSDENGYRPVGSHLPTAPPVPQSVLKALKYLEEHKSSNDKNYVYNSLSNGRK